MSCASDQRLAVIAEAHSWLGTPWHHAARIKGVGVDCIQFLIGVFSAAGLCDNVVPPPYPQDWMSHRSEELMLDGVSAYAHEVETPGPGDIVLFRFGRCFSHAGIVLAYPQMIHAYIEEGAVVFGDLNAGRFAGRPRKYFSVWGDGA